MSDFYAVPRPPLVAPVAGVAAFAFVSLLPRADVIRRTQGMHPDSRRQVIGMWDAVNEAAKEWQERQREQSTGRGTSEPVMEAAETNSESAVPPDWYTTADVAGSLGVSDSFVRRLLRSGSLAGQFTAGRWIVSREAIDDYKLSRKAA